MAVPSIISLTAPEFKLCRTPVIRLINRNCQQGLAVQPATAVKSNPAECNKLRLPIPIWNCYWNCARTGEAFHGVIQSGAVLQAEGGISPKTGLSGWKDPSARR
jgi:hypothetical protein